MNDEPIIEYLRSRAQVEPPFDLVDAVAAAVATTPQGRTWSFSAWIPAVAAVGAAAVILVVSLLIGQVPNIGPSPAPSTSAEPSATPARSASADPSATPDPSAAEDLSEPGNQVTLDALDQGGTWGTIILTRGEDIAGYAGFTDPEQFLVQVHVDYEPARIPEPAQFGASDWGLRPTDPEAEFFFYVEPTNSRAQAEGWPTPEPLLGQYPGAVDIMTTPTDGWIQFLVSRREASLELELVYAPEVGEVAAVRVRLPGAASDAEPTPTPGPGEPRYVDRPGLPFSVIDSEEADALFIGADTCTNPVDGYTVSYPDSWYTNTEIGEVPACSWFTPTFFEATEPGVAPDEIWISIGTIDSAFGYIGTTEVFASEELAIGGRQGRRLEYNPDPNGEPDYRGYHYVIELGESSATGPTFIAQTDNEIAPDYALAKAVLDRIMASLEFTEP